MNSDKDISEIPIEEREKNRAVLDAHMEGQYPQVQQFAVDESIMLRIIGDGTPHGTIVIDAKSGRKVEGITGIFVWMDANKAFAKCAITFQRFETDLYPPLEHYMNADLIKEKLFSQGYTVVVDEEGEVE